MVAGGALFNFIFAILLFIVAYMALGNAVNEARIGEVTEGMPAAEAGMLAGDEITAINRYTYSGQKPLRSSMPTRAMS